VFSKGEHVLIAYSGGSSSSALLNLIADGLSINARRRLQFQAHVAFIDGRFLRCCFFFIHFVWLESSLFSDATNIREQVTDLVVNRLKYPLHIVSIDEDNSFKEILFEKTKTLTAREELVRRRKYEFHFCLLGIVFDWN